MKQKDLDAIASAVRRETAIDRELLDAYASYLRSCWDEMSVCCQEEPIALLVPERRIELPKEERELQSRIEEAKEKETFSDRLLRLIKEANKTAPEVYRAAGIDSRHFSKINSHRDYKPTKETVLAFAIALQLSVEETEELLEKAGFSFSSASSFDVSIRFFLEECFYDRTQIDLIMEKFGIPLLPQNF